MSTPERTLHPVTLAEGWSPGGTLDSERLRETVAPKAKQLELF